MQAKKILELREISKNFGKMSALSSLSFSIKKGETVALVGPSGAGKTTLLNILANTVKPDKGSLLIDGIPSYKYTTGKQLSRKIGIIRQQFDLVGQLPVIHNVLAGRLGEWGFFKSLLSLILPQDKELAIKSLDRVGIPNKIYEKTSNLSGGEQQRVALARLLVQNPEIILADEPVSSLDPSRAEDILSMLIKLVKEENQTLIASLHSVEYAKRFFTRIIGLREGKICFDLPVEKITDADLFTLYNLEELK
ncbi:MAG: phosphonate transport system ATP-binding protein [Candidatus Petromonas sp.]|jgi:phosphonate transport system ATP-binding protein|nr:phosphonate transport system ATP-binding protein [Candidatus Petromonas sp.]